MIQIDTNAGIVLPNGASFTDASPELTFQDENTDSDVIASLSYTYNEEPVGTADISLTKDNLQEFTFDKETDSDETADTDGTENRSADTFYKINVRMILIVAGILLLLFLLYRLASPSDEDLPVFHSSAEAPSKTSTFPWKTHLFHRIQNRSKK